MEADALERLPRRPPSEVEWEDLLVRLEIVPRVVRNTLEAVRRDDPRVADLLRERVTTEARVGRWLESLVPGAAAAQSRDPEPADRGDADALSHRFSSLRARTFAMVQRRGVEVWEWEGALEPGRPVTVYQVLRWLALGDAAALAALREAAAC